MDFYQTDKVNRLMELGNLHNVIQEYIEKNNSNKNGSVASGTAHCLHKELGVYYDSINKLQREVFLSCYFNIHEFFFRIVDVGYFYPGSFRLMKPTKIPNITRLEICYAGQFYGCVNYKT